MEKEILIKRGFNLPYQGTAKLEIDEKKNIKTVALKPLEFKGIKPKLIVKEGQPIKRGEAVFVSKNDPETVFVSPVSGTIASIILGERRRLDQINVAVNDTDDTVLLNPLNIEKDSRETLVQWIKKSGLAMYFRQRPLNIIPNFERVPKSIFINAMGTEPGALDQDFILKGKEDIFQVALNLLSRLTAGKVYVCYGGKKTFEFQWSSLKGAECVKFTGPHPSGLTSTHIHFLDPINKGDIVWTLKAIDLLNIGNTLKSQIFDSERYYAVSGQALKNPIYIKSVSGVSVSDLLKNQLNQDPSATLRIISGTVLYGDRINPDGFMNALDVNLQVIEEGRERFFMGWAGPGFNGYSIVSRCFPTAFNPSYMPKWNANIKGGHRAIVQTDVYDDVMPMDILTNFLVKAVLVEDMEEAEKLGILEVDAEDFALATFLCPSKTNVCQIIDSGLKLIEKEGY